MAGGCCHTYIEKGYEFDVGIHYIGNLNTQTPSKTLLDQLTNGQLQWAPLDDEFDTAVFGDKRYSVLGGGRKRWIENIKKQFPDNIDDVDRLCDAVIRCKKSNFYMAVVKFLPVWLSQLLVQTGLFSLISDIFKWNDRTVLDVVSSETKNKDLQAYFMYCFGDYGTAPDKAGFPMQATLLGHFWNGGAYPVGGGSEIAFHMIPVIEEAGGRVLVRAEVSELLMDELRSTVIGVKVKKASGAMVDVRAPMVISNAGIYNTMQRLVPRPVAETSRLVAGDQTARTLCPASPCLSGINAPLEKIRGEGDSRISARNWWVFTSNDLTKCCDDYMSLSVEEALDSDVPLLFISFPSTKDPEWEKRYPGKTTMAIVSLANYDWFKQWENERCKKRGADYEGVKNTIGDRMVAQATRLFPQIKDHIDYVSCGSPLSNNFYLAAPRGEMYGLDHSQQRFSAENQILLRPDTDVPANHNPRPNTKGRLSHSQTRRQLYDLQSFDERLSREGSRPTEPYGLMTAYPRRMLWDGSLTLRECGLVPQWCRGDDKAEQHVNWMMWWEERKVKTWSVPDGPGHSERGRHGCSVRGVLSAGVILGRNCLNDVDELHKRLEKAK
ncbi:putative all-trans-retinol 13,14-reductase [Amphibalanus amphitrite]|uniref:Putative all-trans-retinol 13,14-reductase n=1 Tax=Amphibalanus amphitrite TaxID=1232801 RepID=A0A6A4W566_AMPAM|nr:putative all-trans-retinol 13,14-reductase [Amphibalanus amphitrite]